MKLNYGTTVRGTAGVLALLAATVAAQAQTVTMYGALSNFDVINLTGQETHGFEIEIHGVNSIGGSFYWNRYGAPQVEPIPGTTGGVYVRYMSPWDPATQKFMQTTPVAIHPTATNGHQCVMGTLGYDTSGCEHFGVWTTANPTQTIYRWLVADPNNPGKLIAGADSLVAIPAPLWTVQPPAAPADPVVIVAAVDPPIPPPPAKTFGEAQWMKTYKTENARQVGLDELVADNVVVPQDAAHIETAWDLVQSELGSNSRRKQKRGALGNGSHAVVRRFEFYKYTGNVNPVTGQAVCADGLCLAPADGEVGDFIGAQNAAANLNVPAQYNVVVTIIGDGSVESSDRVIRCPGACVMPVTTGGSVTLTAINGKGTFSGWTGACQGMSLTCTFKVNSDAPVTATFTPQVRLTVKVTGLGTVTSNPGGNSVLAGTAVTLTATPAAGYVLAGWGTACAGTAATCTVVLNADTTVNVTFASIVAPPPPPPTTSYKLVLKTNGKGTVSSNPSGSSFPQGSVVTVTAVPDPTATWTGWTGGGCSGLALTCTVTINADTTVQANFR
jgi:Divergent InlB B-repeat domain